MLYNQPTIIVLLTPRSDRMRALRRSERRPNTEVPPSTGQRPQA